ncbi:hypothetical protein FA15DRAFT_706286 [Coprinopsis marcescibilis]|uniref:F-box domain-containing protein n=1 Tax=Coprinopsis marcescibilis TaxID=230819 RepID=A0A5C3KQ58_COPMA|nr:hypothetical protein FA15DRAFT_706286 [Coprinopsis marcescibilis]
MQAIIRTVAGNGGANQVRPQLGSNRQQPSSAAQKCLQVAELLSVIFGMVEDQSRSVDRSQLSKLARTTSAFFGPAIRHLWRDLPDLGAILCLFPKEYVHTEQIQHQKCYTLPAGDLPVLSKEAMERFKVYLPHVKRIGCIVGLGSGTRVHYTALRTLVLVLPQPVFPNLIDVAVPWEDEMEAIFYPPVVFSQSLRHVKVSVEAESSLMHENDVGHHQGNEWDALRHQLDNIAGDIVSFRVEMDGELCEPEHYFIAQALPFDHDLSKRLISLTCLEVEHVIIDSETMTAIAQIPNLDRLKVSVTTQYFKDFIGFLPPRKLPFPSLTALFVRATFDQALDIFLSLVVASKLDKLEVILGYNTRFTNLNKTLEILSDSGMASHLRDFAVETIYHNVLKGADMDLYDNPLEKSFDGLADAQIRVDNDTLDHLSNFTKLTRLCVSPSSSHDLDDSALETAFASWPDLEEFRLVDETMTARDGDIIISKLTVEGIQRALNLCPSLKILALRFDCEPETTLIPSTPHRGLLTWDFGTSSIGYSRKFGEWLKEQYPSLKLLNYYDMYRKALRYVYRPRKSGIRASEDEFIGRYPDAALMLSRWDEVAGLLSSDRSMYSYL